MSQASVWLERSACFDQCFEPGEDAWPAIDTGGVAGIVFRPLVMRDRNFGGLAFWHELYRDAGNRAGRAKGEGVLQKLGRLSLEHLATNVDVALTVGPSTDPVHRTAWFQIDFEFGPAKDDAVGFGGDEALPDFIWRCGEVEDEEQWSLLVHVISFSVGA